MLHQRLMLLLFPVFAIASPVLEAFGSLSIPLFAGPSLALVVSLGGLGLLIGAPAALLLPDENSRTVRHSLFVGSLVCAGLLILDVAAGGIRVLTALASTRAGRLGALFILVAILFATLWPVRQRAAPLLFIASGAFFASTVALNLTILATGSYARALPAPSVAATDRPPFVYLVLDEAMGVEGLKAAPGGRQFANELRDVFERHGFRVHGGAFSRHFFSAQSIPNALNFDYEDDTGGEALRHHTNQKVHSAIFDRLAREGYDVISYGTEHIDFCFTVASRCEVLPSFNPFSPYLGHKQLQSKALYLLMRKAFAKSYLLSRSFGFLLAQSEEALPVSAHFDGFAFPRWFERFKADLISSPRGRAYFAHMLMPHAPYVLDAACSETGKGLVFYYLKENRHLVDRALDEARTEAYRHYRLQYGCVVSKVDSLLTRLHSMPEFHDATIVVHGDHGSRISAGQFAENLSERDMVDNYSTLYAIRSPDVTPGYDARKTSVQRLTAEYFSGEGVELGADNLTVAIDAKEEGRVVIRPMPDYGQVPGG